VYARIWTKVGGVWRFRDSTFTTPGVVATLIAPVNGATNVDVTQPIQWTTVPHAQAYYLYVGTAVGANDLVNSREIQLTSFPATGIQTSRMVFARGSGPGSVASGASATAPLRRPPRRKTHRATEPRGRPM
jgi:hypothetical protein